MKNPSFFFFFYRSKNGLKKRKLTKYVTSLIFKEIKKKYHLKLNMHYGVHGIVMSQLQI